MTENINTTEKTLDQSVDDALAMQAADRAKRMMLQAPEQTPFLPAPEQTALLPEVARSDSAKKLGKAVFQGALGTALVTSTIIGGAGIAKLTNNEAAPVPSGKTIEVIAEDGDGLDKLIGDNVENADEFDVRDLRKSIADDPANLAALEDGVLQVGEVIEMSTSYTQE